MFILCSSTYEPLSLRKVCHPSQHPPRIRPRLPSLRWLNPNPSAFRPRRFQSLISRCSITDRDAQYSHVATEDQVESNVAVEAEVPIVHLKSGVIETDSSTLLNEAAYVDSLFIVLPVLSEEEQNVLAATPAHPAGLYALYASCLAGNLVEQLWNFAWPSAIALLHPSLLPVAVMGFFAKLTIMVGGPLVGKLMDSFPRLPAYNILNTVQAVAQLISAAMIIHAHSVRCASASPSSVLHQPWFIFLVLAGSIERLSGVALGVAMERDWVVLVFNISTSIRNNISGTFALSSGTGMDYFLILPYETDDIGIIFTCCIIASSL